MCIKLLDQLSQMPECDGCEFCCYLGAQKKNKLYYPTINGKKINETDKNGNSIMSGPYTTYETAIRAARAAAWLCERYNNKTK